MRATIRGYLVLALAVGCIAFAFARGSDVQRDTSAENMQMPPPMVTSMRELFPH